MHGLLNVKFRKYAFTTCTDNLATNTIRIMTVGSALIRRFVLINSCLTYQQSSKTSLLLLKPIFGHSLE